MKFYGHGTVWDKDRNKALARFGKSGEFETEDPRTIQILEDRGYKFDEKTRKGKTKPPQEPETPKPGPETKGTPDDVKDIPDEGADTYPVDFDAMSLEDLKKEADAIGVKYAKNIGQAKLAARLKEIAS